MKKILALMLSIILSLTMTCGVIASNLSSVNDLQLVDIEGVEICVVTDTDEIRVIESEDETSICTVTYNKNKRTAKIKIKEKSVNKNSSKLKEFNVNLKNLKASTKTIDGEETEVFDDIVSVSAASIYQNTFSNYEYTKWIGNPNKWELRRPKDNSFFSIKYFQTYETDDNESYIKSFKSNVDKLNSTEIELIFAESSAILMDALAMMAVAGTGATAGALTPAAVAAIGGAVTANGVFINKLVEYNNNIRDCYNDYWETYSNSDIL